VSFISLALVLGPIGVMLRDRGTIVALVKPQFEAGRGMAPKGVVRDPEIHREVLRTVAEAARSLGLGTRDVIRSPITGPEGNREFLAWFGRGPSCADLDRRIEAVTS
jgi:23S rRNA (cytidine1920-2'-O)/16S rRNA (cytidine1409-2'-O)-methyltransferase